MRYQYKRKKQSKVGKMFSVIAIIILASTGSILLYSIYLNIDIADSLSGQNREEQYERLTSQNIVATEKTSQTEDIEIILEEVTDTVVGISKIKNIGSSIFLKGSGTEELGLGTGVIVAEDGYILTNWHVAGDRYSTCYVTIENGNTYNGQVVWANEYLDLAIVKIPVKGLNYITLGDSDQVKVGRSVYAIGNPIGFEFQKTVTFGILSGTNRTIKLEEDGQSYYMEDLLQTDATINPGNSGGPLILANRGNDRCEYSENKYCRRNRVCSTN